MADALLAVDQVLLRLLVEHAAVGRDRHAQAASAPVEVALA
jgi:hypothetical protein